MGKLNVDDTSSSLKSFKIGNTLFTFYQRGKLAAINSIRMDFSSQFTFNLNDKLIFSPEFKLGDFEENFSKSFSCGEVIATSLIDEQSALRIDNSVESSRLKFIILYFNHAENLSNVGFYYEGFNI